MPTLSIETTAGQASRIATALGRERGLVDDQGNPRSATPQEVRAFVVDVLKRLVDGQEQRAAEETARAAVTPMNLS